MASGKSATATSMERLLRLAVQVGPQLGPARPGVLAKTCAADAVRAKSFAKGLLAHLILVPSWTTSPAILLAALIVAGAPLGGLGVAASLCAGVSLVAANSHPFRAFGCAMLAVLGLMAPTGRGRLKSLLATGLTSTLVWMATAGGEFVQRPALIDFLFEWAKDYYTQAELRGALHDVRPKRSFFAFHPHGCLSAGWTINGTFNRNFMRSAGRVTWLIDNTLRHKNPFFRVLCDGFRDTDRAIEAGTHQGFKTFMSRGESVAFIPGGFQDAVAFKFGRDCTVLRKRKGFIKYCLQYGYRLHPVYTFGECETFHTFTGLEWLRMKVSESNIPMVMFFGWPLFPILPRTQSRILTYVGRGMDLPHIPEPTAADVEHWHGRYLEALQALFEEHKAEAGYPQAQLEIL